MALRDGTEVLPIFPLNMVALPGSSVPLNIFEARYRVLFSTLLSGLDDVDEGLINPDVAWHGTRTFGLCAVSGQGQMAAVGCTCVIEKHKTWKDGQILIESTGQERFIVTEVVQEKPIVLCKVDTLEDVDVDLNTEVQEKAEKVRELLKNTLTLSYKLNPGVAELPSFPPELETLQGSELSFWVASLFEQAQEKQNILEITSVKDRLEREEEVLESTLNYLRAASAIKDAGPSTDGDAGNQ